MFKTDADEDAPELARELPEITEGQTFDKVEASTTEHFTTPRSPTPRTRFCRLWNGPGPRICRRTPSGRDWEPRPPALPFWKSWCRWIYRAQGKQLLPTKDGHNLACVLPNVLTSPKLTAEWETKLTAIAKGEADPDGFMADIEEMTRGLIVGYSQISEDAQKLFQAERVVIGKCPRCGEAVYEGKKNYYCGNRACQFVMWKNDRFLRNGQGVHAEIAAHCSKTERQSKGPALHKTGKTYDGTVLLADTGGKYVNYRIERRDKTKNSKHRECSHTPGKSLSRPFCRSGIFSLGKPQSPV